MGLVPETNYLVLLGIDMHTNLSFPVVSIDCFIGQTPRKCGILLLLIEIHTNLYCNSQNDENDALVSFLKTNF